MAEQFPYSIEAIIAVVFLVSYLLCVLYYAIDLYILTPSRKNTPLNKAEIGVISENLAAYNLLSIEQQEKFRKRVSRFRANKQFVFSKKDIDNKKIQLLLCATATLLTMGFRDYRITSVERILIYPSEYFSRITRQNHLGEFNPNLKLLVFSAEHILKGFENATDNLNLGVHEFAHALIFNFKSKYSFNALKFNKGQSQIEKLLQDESFLQKVEQTEYFREYGQTNIHEFFAVALENFVETPSDFITDFPELYSIITNMLNFEKFDFHKPRPKTVF